MDNSWAGTTFERRWGNLSLSMVATAGQWQPRVDSCMIDLRILGRHAFDSGQDRTYDVGHMVLPQITWQDVQQLPDDGNRYEAIEGDLYMTPAPTVRHQTLSLRLELALVRLLVETGHGQLLHAPVGVEFPATGEGVQPDILFISNDRRGIVAEDVSCGAPDIVVEILSPSTSSRDRGIKLRLYERQGVAQYWIVDPKERAVDVWRFRADARHERFVDRLPVRLAEEEFGEIDLEEIFAAE